MIPSDVIPVTRPSLPPLDDFVESLRGLWESRWLTNNGKYHRELEAALAEYLDVPYVSLFCNGTIALQVGLQALGVTGEVITTPFSFAATTHAVHWNHCIPVFCDIEPDTFNLDPAKLESLITPETTCILPVHVYGNPCDLIRIKEIADKHSLKVFYDAAHAFGVRVCTESLLGFGDLSMLSFHATKVFNTVEGGALVTGSAEMKRKIDHLKNFGFANETTVIGSGTNGKMNELQAAFGLLLLKQTAGEILKRGDVARAYRAQLNGIPGLRVLDDLPGVTHNYSYFPVFVDEETFGASRDDLYFRLKEQKILARRYFYPLISSFPSYDHLPSSAPDHLPVANRIADQVLCLPIYADLSLEAVQRIADIVRSK